MAISDIARMIDHTLLKPEATLQMIEKLCEEARQYGFASVCVNPYWVEIAAKRLDGSSVKTCTVAGFPLGANQSETKADEAKRAIQSGAREVDMVMNIGALRSGDAAAVLADIRAVLKVCQGGGAVTKVILETSLLSREEKVSACKLCVEAGVDFVKTSTGFAGGGATVDDVALMRQTVGPLMGVKASGGIRSYEDARKMIDAGATRIGTSSGVAIVSGAQAAEGSY